MSNLYIEMCSRHHKDIINLPKIFAFDRKGLAEGMKELCVASETDIVGIGGGCYMRQADYETLVKISQSHRQELMEAIENDKTGKGFISDMFAFELSSDEYDFTDDDTDTIERLDLSCDDFEKFPALSVGLNYAKKRIHKNSIWK